MTAKQEPKDPRLLTPFLEKILSLVAATCKPQVQGWEEELRRRLQEEFYAPFAIGEVLTAERLNAQHFRLLEAEKKLSSPNPAKPTLGEHPNFQHSQTRKEMF